jgi:hypothetical protein
VLPLRRDFALAWIAATGFHGYDTEMHELYESLVRGPRPLRVFYDVGASYGLHSLKLLAHGAGRVVRAEHRLPPILRGVLRARRPASRPAARRGRAVSGPAELRIPNGQSWLGTTAAPAARRWTRGSRWRRPRSARSHWTT